MRGTHSVCETTDETFVPISHRVLACFHNASTLRAGESNPIEYGGGVKQSMNKAVS
jgi:hypothetical protein